MNYLYLGSFPTTELIEKTKGQIDSLYRDDQSLIEGMRQNGKNVTVLTIPDMPTYPLRQMYYKGFYDQTDNAIVLPLLNLKIVKAIWIIWLLYIKAHSIICSSSGKTVVFIPYIILHHVLPGFLLKLRFRNKVRIVTVVPDIFFPESTLSKAKNKIAEYFTKKSDAFVLYTEAMADYLRVKNKYHIVIEGFKDFKHPIIANKNKTKFIVTYTGSLNLNYGIGRLVDSMQFITERDIELHLYGAGSGVEYIKNASIKDSRIKYYGLVPKEKANEAMYSADVLVNPRNDADGEYVAYSFPSKDIDYLGSGIPCVLCKLPGMPKEYYGYFEDAGKGTAQELADAILNIYNMAPDERKCKAKNAQIFITERMDCMNQGKKIYEMLKKLEQ